MRRLALLMVTVMCLSMVVGCAANANQGRRTVSRNSIQRSSKVGFGTILAVEQVTIEASGTSRVVGTGAGAVAGGVIGRAVVGSSGSNTRNLGALAGAGVGAAAGSAAERRITNVAGVELEVEMENGEIFLITQVLDDDYQVGDFVRVFRADNGEMRVRQ
jgi:outer membrane lipoprotein SlyB